MARKNAGPTRAQTITLILLTILAALLLTINAGDFNLLRCDNKPEWLGQYSHTDDGGYRAWQSCSETGAWNLSNVQNPYFILGISWNTYEGYVETIDWSEALKRNSNAHKLEGWVGDTNWRPPSSENVIGGRLYTVETGSESEAALLSEYGSTPYSIEASIESRIERKGGVCEGFCLDYQAIERQLQPSPEEMTTYIISLPQYLRQQYTEANGWTCEYSFRYTNTNGDSLEILDADGRLEGQKCYFEKPSDLKVVDLYGSEPEFTVKRISTGPVVDEPTTVPTAPSQPVPDDCESTGTGCTSPNHDVIVDDTTSSAPNTPTGFASWWGELWARIIAFFKGVFTI
jgi:hypothetical protein